MSANGHPVESGVAMRDGSGSTGGIGMGVDGRIGIGADLDADGVVAADRRIHVGTPSRALARTAR
jgi:hypothetical protein